jgi:hypothetical protein
MDSFVLCYNAGVTRLAWIMLALVVGKEQHAYGKLP